MSLAMAHSNDQWVRLFNVSDPRRAYAGYTLYKVTSKVFQKDFPEGITEITVWRRFKDFKKLHQELLKIYSQTCNSEGTFPAFPKAKFFGRFDDAVIEERQKGALELLMFAGNTPDLFTSQPFIKFFEGGFPDSPVHRDGSISRDGSLSDTEEESVTACSTPKEIDGGGSKLDVSTKKESPSSTLSKEAGDFPEDCLGGVWLYKQPSLSEGLDNCNNSSDEEDADCSAPDPLLVSNAADQGEGTDLRAPSSGQTEFQNTGEEDDDVFTKNIAEDDTSNISDREETPESAEPPQWLVRAISICSEGGDLEILASEADTDEFTTELSFPQAFSEFGTTEEGSNEHEDELSCELKDDSHAADDHCPLQLFTADASDNSSLGNSNQMNTSYEEIPKSLGVEMNSGQTLDSSEFPEKSSHQSDDASTRDSNSSKDSASVGTTEGTQSFTSSTDSGKIIMRQRTISDLGNICIDPKESDYLYNAGHTIHKALDCEVNGMYEEAFSLYRTCVGLLLCGVQGEKDVKRREAVRRKTAQYLLKAEALYNTYLVGNDSLQDIKQQDSSHGSGSTDVQSEPDDLHRFRELTLADLKVIGIVGKVILVENIHNGETFVIKALCKSGPVRTRTNSHGSDCHRRKSVRRIYGKYPNIVRLYKCFETASAIYLLLEYARGGKLWDHLSCYQRSKESQDYLIGSRNKNTNYKKFSQHSCDEVQVERSVEKSETCNDVDISVGKNTKESSCVTVARQPTPEPLSSQVANRSSVEASPSSFDQSGDCQMTTPMNGNNNKTSEYGDVPPTQDTIDKQGKEESQVPPASECSLFSKLDEYFSSSIQYVPEEHIKMWAAELVLAVAYLHTAGVICRDLHPGNVLLDDEGHVLLSYFGLWEETAHSPAESAINLLYCAPELSHVEEASSAVDWWSVGALLYEIITSKALSSAHPWGIQTHTELQLPGKISPEAKSLLRELLRVTPSERLGSGVNGVEEIKSHPFFSGVNGAWLCSRIS